MIYGSQSVTGEALGVAMIVGGFAGMVSCAWPQLKDPVSGNLQLTWGRLKTIRNGKTIGIVIAAAILASASFVIYRHFHSPSLSVFVPTGAPDTVSQQLTETIPLLPMAEPHVSSKNPAVEGNDNTEVGIGPLASIRGSGNTIVGATDQNGNTIVTRPGTAIGAGANAGPGGVAIGAGANGAPAPAAHPPSEHPPCNMDPDPTPRCQVALLIQEISNVTPQLDRRYGMAANAVNMHQLTSDGLVDMLIDLNNSESDYWKQLYPRLEKAHRDAIRRMHFPGEHQWSQDQITADEQEFSDVKTKAGARTPYAIVKTGRLDETPGEKYKDLLAYLNKLLKQLNGYSDDPPHP